jgi:hypothetical protein
MHTEKSLRNLLMAMTLALVSGTLGALAFFSRPEPPVGDAVLGAPQIVLFELDDCAWCQSFRRKAAREFQATEMAGIASLKYLSIEDGPPPKRYKLQAFRQVPMLILFDAYGREVERMMGEPKTGAELEAMVRRNLKRMPKV